MARSLCAVSMFVAAAAAMPDLASQQPASAGATRPNLRVLQALPESQLFPMMNLLADSLGVRCDYCHVQRAPDFTKTPSNVGGWAWDRDDKAEKRIARDMMRMVIDLNGSRVTWDALFRRRHGSAAARDDNDGNHAAAAPGTGRL